MVVVFPAPFGPRKPSTPLSRPEADAVHDAPSSEPLSKAVYFDHLLRNPLI
jgi:hypothetical protein